MHFRYVIAALSAGNFAIGMGAFVVIGLLSPISSGLEVSPAEAGTVMTAYALAYAVCSPLGVALTGAWPRRTVLLIGLSLFAVAALISALSSTLFALLVARVLAAMGAGIFTPVSAGVAIAISPTDQQGKALAGVFFGLTLAQVLGIPAGSYLGYTYGWEAAFLVVTVLSLIMLGVVALVIPRQIDFQVNNLQSLGSALRDWRSLLSVLFTASFLGAIYILFTYVAPLLEAHMNYGRSEITLVLILYGVGAVLGNLLGGRMSDTLGPLNTLVILCVAQALILPMFSFLPVPNSAMLIIMLFWSMFGWAFMVAQQTRLVRQSPERQNVVLALNAAAIYAGAAIGSAIGAVVIEAFGIAMLGVAASLAIFVALVHLLVSDRVALTAVPVQGQGVSPVGVQNS